MKRTIIIIILFLASFAVSNSIVSTTVVLGWGIDIATDDSFCMFCIYVLSFAGTVGLMAIFRRRLHIHLPSFKPEIKRLNLPLILIGLITLLAIGVVIDPVLQALPDSNMAALYDMLSGGLWAIATAVIAAPIIEEYIFRGVLQRSFIGATGSVLGGIALSALIFGLIHIIPQQIISAFFAGLVLGTIFYLTHSLFTVIIIHALNNGIAYIQMLYFGTETDVFSASITSPTAYAILYVACLIFIIGLGFWAVKRIARQRIEGRQLHHGA